MPTNCRQTELVAALRWGTVQLMSQLSMYNNNYRPFINAGHHMLHQLSSQMKWTYVKEKGVLT